MIDSETMKARIKAARKMAGLTQQELAEKSGIPLATIRQYERAVFVPKVDKLSSLAKALDVPLYYFNEDFPGTIEEARAEKARSDEKTRIEDLTEEWIRIILHADSSSYIEAGSMNEYTFYRFVTPEGVKIVDVRVVDLLLATLKSSSEAILEKCTLLEDDYYRLMKENAIPFYLYNGDQK